MAESAITAVLSKLGELAVSETKILLLVGHDIRLLRDQLEWLQAIVGDADQELRWAGSNVDGLTRVWLRQTRDVAFEAEDTLDDFFYEDANLKSKGYRRPWRMLHGCFTKAMVRIGLPGRIQRIRCRLDQISANQKEYNIKHTPSLRSLSACTKAIAAWAWRDDLGTPLGFDEDLKILKKMLLPQDHSRDNYGLHSQHRMFISIVGESGAGKKTLARIICREISSEVEVLVRYRMGPGSSTANLLEEVYRRAYCQCANDHSQVEERICLDIGDKLRGLLSTKRYLLILSGISSKTILNSVRASLPDPDEGTDNGSRVVLLLDTENEEIAWHANTMNINGANGVHLVTPLDVESSTMLFDWTVSRRAQHEELNNQKDAWRYKELVHNLTGGYPMAILLLAGLLRFKKPDQWDVVLQQLSYGNRRETHNNEQEVTSDPSASRQTNNQVFTTRRDMELIFWMSFKDLPNDLKSCFLYLASCHKNISHPADKIVRMWIAEGFIRPQSAQLHHEVAAKGMNLEEFGHYYLKELVMRCLVEVKEMTVRGGIQLFRVHNCIMRLLQTEVCEAGFMDFPGINDDIIPPWVRRLSVGSGNVKRYTSIFANKKFPKLRSFICHIIIDEQIGSHHQQDLTFLRYSKFLRVISVQGLRITKLPDKIGNMINLRYLRVDCRFLRHLPSSIARLLNLQTLDISNTQVEEIDNKFWTIKTLRHVLASNLVLPRTVSVVEEGNGGGELQTLHGVKPVTSEIWSAGNCPLDKMTSLKSLEMHGFEYEKHGGPAFRAALGNMHMLGHLNLQGDEIPSCVFTDPSLRSLQTVVLRGRVNWDEVTADVLRNVRSNLFQLKLNTDAVASMPGNIWEQLRNKLILED